MIRTVLVDDESRLLGSFQTMLRTKCAELEVVAVCRSADEALIKIRETNPDLVFLDIAMPGKDGFALLEEIGDIHFRVIFVSCPRRIFFTGIQVQRDRLSAETRK